MSNDANSVGRRVSTQMENKFEHPQMLQTTIHEAPVDTSSQQDNKDKVTGIIGQLQALEQLASSLSPSLYSDNLSAPIVSIQKSKATSSTNVQQ